MTDAEIKNAIARCALSGITASLGKMLPNGYELTDCDLCADSDRSVQVVVKCHGYPLVFEFTVKEIMPR